MQIYTHTIIQIDAWPHAQVCACIYTQPVYLHAHVKCMYAFALYVWMYILTLKQTQNSHSYLYAYTVYQSAGYARVCCCRCNHMWWSQRIANIRNSCFSRLYAKQLLNMSIRMLKLTHKYTWAHACYFRMNYLRYKAPGTYNEILYELIR